MSALTSTAGSSIQEKPPAEKWLFSEDELINTPSRRDNVPAEKELNYRQQAANLIQDMGQRLPVNQLTINTAIVYMHRFYMFHSFQAFSRFIMAPSALFLAAKVEEQPKKLEHVIRVCHGCLHPDKPHLDVHSDSYLKQAQQLVEHELIMLQTLGFDISIDHPHTHVVKCTQLVKASRDLSQMAYFMATNSLHLTTFCLKYKPTVVSAMCIHLSCKWSNYEIPLSHEGKAYWAYMDPTITEALLENIIKEFLKILNLCPTRLRKLKNYRPSSKDGSGGSTPQSRDGQQPRSSGSKVHPSSRTHHSPAIEARRPGQHPSTSDSQKKPPAPIEPQKKPPASITIAEYKNKREKELQQAKPNTVSGSPQMKPHASSGMKPPQRPNHPPTSAPPHGHQVKTEPHANKHPPKVPANHHKRPDKQQQHPHALKPSTSGAPSGPHRHKHPVPSHGPPAHHQHKEHVKMQSIEQHHRMPHPTHHQRHPQQKPREHIVPKTEPMLTETSPRTHNPPPNTGKSDDNLLAGIEQQVMEQIKAEKAKETFIKTEPGSSGLPKLQPFEKPITSHPTKDPKSRHSLPNAPTSSHPQAPPVGKTYKLLYEQYKKNPDALKQQLKHKAQSEPLTEEEKQIWHKLKKKEEDKIKKKRKHEKQQKLHRSQPVEGTAEKGKSTPGGGPLTVRIKLPPSARAEMSKSQGSGSSGLHIGSSSGSGSEAMLSSPGTTVAKLGRKRTHAHDSGGADPISAKHSRKSEGHHHQSHQHHSSHESSRHRHRHSRPGSHHHSKSQQQPPGHKIDDSTFQQALNNAVSMVQSGQAAPGTSGTDKPVPTVTLKRTGVQNGSGDYAHSSRHDKSKATKRSKQLGFDPSAPVSATPPEDLFDADGGEHSKPENYNVLAPRNTELSSPETGEIHDDDSDASPLREHVLQQNYTHRQGTASNNNSGHRNQQWPSSSGGIHQQHSNQRPPNLTHGKHDGRKNYDNRMPTMPSLTSKPNRTEQR